MKLPLLITLAFLPCLALAQGTSGSDSDSTPSTNQPSCSGPKHGHHHHHFSPEKQLAFLTSKLGLSTDQQATIGPILVSRDAQLKTIFQDKSLTKEQKHEQIKALFESTNTEIEAALTPEQVTQFEALHQHHAKPAHQ